MDFTDFIDYNFFESFFGNSLDETYKNELDDFWEHGEVQRYYSLLNRCKNQGFSVLRNSKGQHKVIRK